MSCPNPLFICPVVKGCYVTRGFHTVAKKHPIHAGKKPHYGVDLRGATGDEVRSVADGVIELDAYNAGGWGKYFKIKHDDGAKTLYAHLSKKASGLSKDSKVKKGEKIGDAGATGGAKGSHLHFEYWPTNSKSRVDPWPCIAQTGPGTGVYPNGKPWPGTPIPPAIPPPAIPPPIPRPSGSDQHGYGESCSLRTKCKSPECKCSGFWSGKCVHKIPFICPRYSAAMDGSIYSDYYPLVDDSDYSVNNVYGLIIMEFAIIISLMAIIGCMLFAFLGFVYYKFIKVRKRNEYQSVENLDRISNQ